MICILGVMYDRLAGTFIVATCCGIIGILVTYFFMSDFTGVNLADEDEKFMKYLAENGWEGEVGEDDIWS